MEYLQRELNLYCERQDASLWSEPVNFVTNAAFILVALLIYYQFRSYNRRLPFKGLKLGDIDLLALLALCIGIGSSLFHSLATQWAQLSDVVPITLFILLYIGLVSHQEFGNLGPSKRLVWLVFGALNLPGLLIPQHWAQGSQNYLGTCLMFFALSWWSRRRIEPAALYLIAGVLFSLSLFFRSIDGVVCDQWTMCTHFLWHLLNALVIYLSVLSYVRLKTS